MNADNEKLPTDPTPEPVTNVTESAAGKLADPQAAATEPFLEAATDKLNQLKDDVVASVSNAAADLDLAGLKEQAADKIEVLKEQADETVAAASAKLEEIKAEAAETLADLKTTVSETVAAAPEQLAHLKAEAADKLADLRAEAGEQLAAAEEKLGELTAEAAEQAAAVKEKAKGFWSRLFGG